MEGQSLAPQGLAESKHPHPCPPSFGAGVGWAGSSRQGGLGPEDVSRDSSSSRLPLLTLTRGPGPSPAGGSSQSRTRVLQPASQLAEQGRYWTRLPDGGGCAMGPCAPSQEGPGPRPPSPRLPLQRQGPGEHPWRGPSPAAWDQRAVVVQGWGSGAELGARPGAGSGCRCQPRLSCDRHPGQAGWVTGQRRAGRRGRRAQAAGVQAPAGHRGRWLPRLAALPPEPSVPAGRREARTNHPGPPFLRPALSGLLGAVGPPTAHSREPPPAPWPPRPSPAPQPPCGPPQPCLATSSSQPGDLRCSGRPSTAPVPPSLLGHTRE